MSSSTWAALPATTGTSATITGLTPGDTYNIEVIAENAVGQATSAVVMVTMPAAPNAPTNVQAVAESPTSVQVTWTASASGETPISYVVQYQVAS